MLKDRQEILAIGEFALFLAVWLTSLLAAWDSYRHGNQPVTGNNIASSSHVDRFGVKFE